MQKEAGASPVSIELTEHREFVAVGADGKRVVLSLEEAVGLAVGSGWAASRRHAIIALRSAVDDGVAGPIYPAPDHAETP